MSPFPPLGELPADDTPRLLAEIRDALLVLATVNVMQHSGCGHETAISRVEEVLRQIRAPVQASHSTWTR